MFLIEDLSGNTRWDTFVSAVPGVTWEDGLAGGHHRTVRKDRDRLEALPGFGTLTQSGQRAQGGHQLLRDEPLALRVGDLLAVDLGDVEAVDGRAFLGGNFRE